jgi:peptidoglycan/LPS O-acetylase OafA/YrhL
MLKNERISHLDGLRGVAIIFVIMFHAYARWPEYIPWTTQYKEFPIFKFGYMGVQLFFIISGFVIYMTLERCSSFFEFLYRRWIRLFPAMLVATLLVFFSANYLNERPAGIPEGMDMISGLVFIEPSILNKIFGLEFSSIEGAFWSLYVEVKFYLIFGFIYFISKKKSVHLLTALSLLGFGYKVLLYIGLIDSDGFVNFLFDLLSLNHFGWFCVGVFLYLQKKYGGWKYIVWSFVILLTTLALTFGKNIGAILFGFSIYTIFLGCILIDSISRFASNKVFLFFGFVSYPLYLIHENAMVSLTIKIHATEKWLPSILTPIPGLVVIVFIAYLITLYAEPFIKNGIHIIKISLVKKY